MTEDDHARASNAVEVDSVASECRGSSDDSTLSSPRFVRGGTMLVLVAIVYAAVSQGSFYPAQLRVTVTLVFAGLAVSVIVLRLSRRDVHGPVVAAFLVAAWYLVSGLVAHDAAGAVPAVTLLGAMAATVVIVRRADATERELMLVGLLGVGVLVALSGWVGVAWRQSPRALEDGGLWRAASTITYADATGGMLAALAVLALGGFVVERKGRAFTLVAYLLLVGLLATASRAGLIGFVAGLSVLIVLTGGRVLLRSYAILAGVLVGFGALIPSMPASHGPHSALALVGLVIGAAISIAPPRAIAIVAVAIAILFAADSGLRHTTIDAAGTLREDRLTTSSPDRSHELHAALQLAHNHAISGVGPGRVDLTWKLTTPMPLTMHVAYAHDEYLQVLDETGGIGALVLAAGLAIVGVALWRARGKSPAVAKSGCISALFAFGVHSAMDFLWHVPLIPLTGAVLVGVLLPDPGQTT
jgi:hypothetical protein